MRRFPIASRSTYASPSFVCDRYTRPDALTSSMIRAFGADGLAERIRFHCDLAEEFAGWVDAEPGWERMAPVPMSVVCFRWAPPDTSEAERDALNAEILATVNASGRAYLSHTKLGDRYTLRLAVGNLRTERRHVAEAWRLLREAAVRPDVRA